MVSGLDEQEFSFTAHLLPIDRGILETIYVRTRNINAGEELLDIYHRQYQSEKFVRFYPPGSLPDISAVNRTNFCDIGLKFDAGDRTRRHRQRHRQSGEGRRGPSHSEYESDARTARKRRACCEDIVKALIKLGGTLLDAPESRRRLAEEIARAVRDGLEAVVVHGGGKQMTRYLADRGVESRFVNGLRVTTPEVLDAVLKVLAGSVNQELVAALVACGAPAVGLSGMDALLTEARPISDDLGFVGKPVRSDPRLLHALIEFKYLPVVACVAGDRQGNFFNVNADQMAVSVASALQVDKLLFLTDVDGVRGQDNQIRSTLSSEQCRDFIETGVATGGMRAKLESAVEALEAGISEVVIAPGASPDIVAKLLAGEAIGTRLVAPVGSLRHA